MRRVDETGMDDAPVAADALPGFEDRINFLAIAGGSHPAVGDGGCDPAFCRAAHNARNRWSRGLQPGYAQIVGRREARILSADFVPTATYLLPRIFRLFRSPRFGGNNPRLPVNTNLAPNNTEVRL